MFDIVYPLSAVLFDLLKTAEIVPENWFKVWGLMSKVSQSLSMETFFFLPRNHHLFSKNINS